MNLKVGDVFYDKECEDAFVITVRIEERITFRIIMERADFSGARLGEEHRTTIKYMERACIMLNDLTELERIIYGVNIL